ncbi:MULTISPECIES: BTAD domain-containing putative transcriptional regulator [Actinosynnema]|uniref:AfsR/SARP family transcriptional regulator n=1 Tax=Actinosynnema TaxID=40566 RepID=UPI0020A39B82|nr:BTAD domain-containing putative transcriptional regulator [Actinosynnema pretiosum]MCP2092468.1 DNA-binding transcriptional activator of the SARP family [Actinosynnema pretiosum]
MRLRLLGPVELVLDQRSVDIGGPRQRVVLAVLGLNPNRVVPVDQLIDAVWGEAPPSTARSQVQICISALRKLFADAGRAGAITTQSPGYLLRLDPHEVDSVEFAALVARARVLADSGKTAEAAAALRDALALWRGTALSGVPGDLALRSATVLEEQRLAAVEERVRLDLALGGHASVIGELHALVSEHPLRERLHGFLMLALYRAGRQADALEAGRRARAVLVEEVGLEPGRELQRLESAILRRDPALGEPDRHDVTAPPRPRTAPDDVPVGSAGAATGAGPGTDPRTHPGAVPDKATARSAEGLSGGAAPRPRPDQPTAVVVPRQLPASVTDFTGRHEQLAEIVRLLGDESGEPRWGMPVVAISGKGGVGKSSLATRAAHQLAARYPDGQLHADLSSQEGNDHTATLLARFLRALGVAATAVPDDEQERQELYRSKLSGKRVLLVLDDAPGEAEVLPLLPGSPSCAVITTSRIRLSGLPGAHRIDLEVFDEGNSVELLTRVIGHDRVALEPRAAVELVALCGGLPLALRIAGARLASRPHWRLSGLVRRLRDEARRLDEFAHHGLELRSSIGLTHRTLDERARTLLRRCSLVGAPDFPGWTAAALLDTTPDDAEEVLESLVDAQFVDIAHYSDASPRYRLHDLIRVYAAEKLAEDEPPDESDAALRRLLGGWLALADEAHRLEYGGDYTVLHGDAPRWRLAEHEVADHIGASADWWESERRALVAAVRQAAAAGLHELCWDLALTSVTLFEAKGYFDDWRECAEVALAAAERAGNAVGAAAMRYSLGTLHVFQSRFAEARACFTEALAGFDAVGERHGRALVLRNAAHVDGVSGDTGSMLAKYDESLRIMREVGDRIGEAHILRSTAKHSLDEGDTEAATAKLDVALAISRETGCLRVEAQVVHRYAELHLVQGRIEEAREALHRVLRIVRATGDRIGEVHALYGLGVLRQREGRLDSAETTLVHALDLARRLEERMVEGKARYSLGEVALERGDSVGAGAHLGAALGLFDELGAAVWYARTLLLLPEGDGGAVRRGVELLEKVDSAEAGELGERLAARGLERGAGDAVVA